ncbi:glycosyl hydrolase 115 family protein [Pedobacter sp. L105]|uniref:glycosyl hydrolase 115 family protein n=1 Tax=Pedobacter sp. L105 TaxID=1641871 RepID=UPI00131EB028|nr:glycosyl hydrolase 115 family protein [Pedobacter sp. L105]
MKAFTLFFTLFLLFAADQHCLAVDRETYVSSKNGKGKFALASRNSVAPLQVSSLDFPGVILAAKNLQSDIKMVTGLSPQFFTSASPKGRRVVIVGTLGKNPEIDQLVKDKKLLVSGIEGKWETFLIQVVDHPSPGIDQALVIAGSDKRGTIFGIYDLSAKIGVSPWYWWADVPVVKQKELYILPGKHSLGTPAVKYRGIFLNDEAPALSGWTKEKFGGFNHTFYAHVFELILRLKGNYLWPAMWGSAFYDDDPMNAQLADEYGVVIGTSHHEPLMRAHDEWRRYGNKGAWNYSTNAESLRNFWTTGISRMGQNESIVTIGMRGDGDEPMSEGSNIALLEKIVKDQRKIIADVTQKDTAATPQVWALYKEVQDYYDKGMRVPDDVTLLLCDDNWGNIRKLPKLAEKPRSGGYGIYYHFDYVGDPRNYKWLNTNPLPRVWEQMNLAYEYGAKQIWIVNVGDLKPMEFPIEFFLDYAWSPKKWPADQLENYTVLWAEKQFGKTHAAQIASILSRYGKYSSRRKPELLNENTYSLTNYREFDHIIVQYDQLKKDAETVYQEIPANARDAYYQLILHPVLAYANLNALYYAVAKNKLYATQGRAATPLMAAQAKALFENDAAITTYYNTKLSGGKWNHMMDQTHIGYTYWQEPKSNKLPELKEIVLPENADMGVAIEGSASWWPESKIAALLPAFYSEDPKTTYIEVFNRGKKPFHYTVNTAQPWVRVSSIQGNITTEERLLVSVDFSKAPAGKTAVPIIIKSDNGTSVKILAEIVNSLHSFAKKGFQEENGYISMEAAHFSKAVSSKTISWKILPDHGRTLSAVAPYPVTAAIQTPHAESPHLEYQINLLQAGKVKISTYLSPSLDFSNTKGLFYAISIDDETPQLMNMSDTKGRDWKTDVSENINIVTSTHLVKNQGVHTLKFRMVNPGVVLQKIVVETRQIPESYLGPPESPVIK